MLSTLNAHSISRRGRGFDTGRRCLLTLALAYTGAASAVGISANIDAELQSGGQVAVSNSANGVLLDPGDTLTASLSTNFVSSNFNIATTMITGNGTLAMGATVSGASAPPPNGGSLLGGLGGGHIDFEDEITVTSGSVADGTPIQVLFSFAAASTATLAHSDALNQSINNAGVDYQFSGRLLDVTNFNFVSMDVADNRLQEDFAQLSNTAVGIWTGAGTLEILFDTFVGDTIEIDIRLLTRIGVGAWSTGVGNVNIENGSAIGAAAIAFGASFIAPSPFAGGSISDVILESALLGGEFPSADFATTANAQAALAAVVPVPPMVWLFAACAAGLLRLRGRSAQLRVQRSSFRHLLREG